MTPPARLGAPTLVLVVAALGTSPLGAQAVDSTTLRPTDVVVTIQNDAHYNGTYRAHGISRICGKLDLMMPHRNDSFVVEFPDDEPNLEVRALSFDADTLAAGTITNSFYLSVAVRVGAAGAPPAFVVRAKQPQYNEPGRAERYKAQSRDSLEIAGTATTGTKVAVRATVVCHPQP